MKVSNRGWEWVPLEKGAGCEEEIMRGFSVVKHETEEVVFERRQLPWWMMQWWLPIPRCLLGC